MDELRGYIAEMRQTLRRLPVEKVEEVIGTLQAARAAGKTVFILGNGGSAATASHFVCDLAKNTRQPGCPLFRVVGLADNMPIFSAYANDEGYENVFAQQLASLVREGDVVIAISASGNSPNVLRALELARQSGATTIGFSGFDGGRLGHLVDIHVHVPSHWIEQVEDAHLVLQHMICSRLRSLGDQPAESGLLTGAEPGKRNGREASGISAAAPAALAPAGASALAAPAGNVDVRELMQRMLALAVESVGASSGCVILVDDERKPLTGILTHRGRMREAPGEVAETIERGLAGWVLENRRAVIVRNTLDDPRWLRREWEEPGQATRSALSVPLLDADRILGVMTLVNPAADQFSEGDLALVSALAAGVALVATRARTRARS
jgi:D-sedoheptulose 7-phosphate isomerase